MCKRSLYAEFSVALNILKLVVKILSNKVKFKQRNFVLILKILIEQNNIYKMITSFKYIVYHSDNLFI